MSTTVDPIRTPVVLVADDDDGNRELLRRRLEKEGYSVIVARHGAEAMTIVRRTAVDLVLLDIMMPELDGIGVLSQLKADSDLRELPVVMITAVDDVESVARCIRLGADDYIPKPFNPTVLRARVGALYDRKRLREAEKAQSRELNRQREIAQNLLLNILPAKVASELSDRGTVEPMYFEDATVVFTDFVGFTLSTEQLPADDLVAVLDRYFSVFDEITARYQLEKLKTIGDSYMFAGGLPERSSSHPVDAILASFEIIDAAKNIARTEVAASWDVRVGVHTGPVIAGIVGRRKFAFDVWGDTVNLASRMESAGAPNRVNMSAITFSRVKDFFSCERRGQVRTKDGRHVEMYFADTIVPALMSTSPPWHRPRFWERYRTYFGRDPFSFPRFLLDGAQADAAIAASGSKGA